MVYGAGGWFIGVRGTFVGLSRGHQSANCDFVGVGADIRDVCTDRGELPR